MIGKLRRPEALFVGRSRVPLWAAPGLRWAGHEWKGSQRWIDILEVFARSPHSEGESSLSLKKCELESTGKLAHERYHVRAT